MNGNQLSLKYAESHYPKSDKMIQKKIADVYFCNL